MSGKFGGVVTWQYGAVTRNADIQKWSGSIFCLAVDLVPGLFEAASDALSLELVSFHNNSVIIFYFPFFVQSHDNTWAAIEVKNK